MKEYKSKSIEREEGAENNEKQEHKMLDNLIKRQKKKSNCTSGRKGKKEDTFIVKSKTTKMSSH